MPDTQPWQYKTISVPHRYEWAEHYREGHKLRLTAKRRKGDSGWAFYLPRCSCKLWKGEWCSKQIIAYDQHTRHVVAFAAENPTLF
jgi:hypothetical protein